MVWRIRHRIWTNEGTPRAVSGDLFFVTSLSQSHTHNIGTSDGQQLVRMRSLSIRFVIVFFPSGSFFISDNFCCTCAKHRRTYSISAKMKKEQNEKRKNAALPCQFECAECSTAAIWLYDGRLTLIPLACIGCVSVGGSGQRYARDILLVLLRSVQWPMLCTYQKVNALRSDSVVGVWHEEWVHKRCEDITKNMGLSAISSLVRSRCFFFLFFFL